MFGKGWGGNLESFERLGIAPDTLDTDLWQLCQTHQIVLLTGNRNAEGTDSLEAAIASLGTPAVSLS